MLGRNTALLMLPTSSAYAAAIYCCNIYKASFIPRSPLSKPFLKHLFSSFLDFPSTTTSSVLSFFGCPSLFTTKSANHSQIKLQPHSNPPTLSPTHRTHSIIHIPKIPNQLPILRIPHAQNTSVRLRRFIRPAPPFPLFFFSLFLGVLGGGVGKLWWGEGWRVGGGGSGGGLDHGYRC